MIALLKKEFSLCLHPTCFIFLAFSLFVFISNYPYEVMFFFSGLSVFFVCLTARENGDAAFTVAMPVKKRSAAVARICACAIFQGALLCLAAVTTTIKECLYPVASQVNMAGMSANTAFLGEGAMLLGVFNLIFFPLYYNNPQKVGIPFLLASVAQFLLIILSIVLRFTVPFFGETLSSVDPQNMGVKFGALFIGLALYALFTAVSVLLSSKRFEATDL